ncbi:MAG: M1 family aminopeptidase [Bacteroidota bacterium]
MKKLLLLISFLPFIAQSQENPCAKAKQRSFVQRIEQQARTANTNSLVSHELKYDVKFVHLDLNLERYTTYIRGNVKTVATVINPLDTFMTLLHSDFVIDSVRFNGALLPSLRVDSIVKVKVPATLPGGSSFTVIVHYRGYSPPGGSAIGSAFDTELTWQPYSDSCTWSLSEPFGAYRWWPCKQSLTDKIDSSWVSVTTDSTNKVGSNGRLKNVVTIGNKKRYEWKSRTLIDYYLISVAVARYKEYNIYAKPLYLNNDSILIQNYIFASAINHPFFITNEKPGLDQTPALMKLYSNLFGMYPFYKEKYGHCMAPLGGGMEHQTMTTLGFFDFYLVAHELGHQWWGDNVTCKRWNDIFINEGFATYCGMLAAQYLDPASFASEVNDNHNNVMGAPGGSCYFTNQDTMKASVIFDGRLTYSKGGSIIRSLQFVTNNDSLWFGTLRGFQNTYKNSNATVIDFKNYYQAQTGINPTQFFNQWYYGEGYPTFHVKYNSGGGMFVFQSTQTVSKPTVTPFFITPIEYRIKRTGYADTIVRVMQNTASDLFSFNLQGTVTGVFCDPNNWLINKATLAVLDTTLASGINITQAGVDEIKIAPNPSRGIFTVHNPANLTGSIMVWDLQGRLIMQREMEGNSTVDLSRYARGLYELRIINRDKQAIYSQKIISE